MSARYWCADERSHDNQIGSICALGLQTTGITCGHADRRFRVFDPVHAW
jgi:hypothetical protein